MNNPHNLIRVTERLCNRDLEIRARSGLHKNSLTGSARRTRTVRENEDALPCVINCAQRHDIARCVVFNRLRFSNLPSWCCSIHSHSLFFHKASTSWSESSMNPLLVVQGPPSIVEDTSSKAVEPPPSSPGCPRHVLSQWFSPRFLLLSSCVICH